MSSSTIARWNAIPMVRPDESSHLQKRPRSNDDEEDDSSEDNVSLVSRSPSPQPQDVDMVDVSLYDEHVKGPIREVITVETKIKSTNKGFAMLAKMGWVEGSPVGLSGDGRVDPVPFTLKQDSTGLGKVTQDIAMIETTVSQRRGLDSERMTKETEEQKRAREDAVAQKAAVQSEISSVLRAFYCELCDKQFKTVAQYDEHTNSYAHHHKARMKDMQANHPLKQGGKEEADRRREKERKREEKELKKIAAAAGIKLVKPSTGVAASDPKNSSDSTGFTKTGWATVNSPATSTPNPARWASVPQASSLNLSSQPAPPSLPPPGPPPPPAPAPPSNAPHSTSFRSSGWSTLPTNSVAPPPPSPSSGPPPPPPSIPQGGGWARVTHPPPPPISRAPRSPPPQQPFSPRGCHERPPSAVSSHAAPLPPAPLPQQPRSHDSPATATNTESTGPQRSSWQQWQKKRGGKR